MLRVRCPGPLGSCSPVCPLGALCCVCGVLGHLAPVHRCVRSVCCVVCAVSWATWLLFTGAPARCVVLRVRCLGPLGFCSSVCPLGALCCACGVGVLGHLAPVHRWARSVCCGACAVSWATWLLFPVCPLGALCCACGVGVLGHLAPVHRCARSVCCVACAVSWATWLLFTGVLARCVVLCVRCRCPGPLGSCSPVYPLRALCRVCSVLGRLASVHRCARSVRCVACAVCWAAWLLFTGVPARCVVLRVRCPELVGSWSPVCSLGALCCVCGVLGHLAPVHRCVRSVCCVVCAVSWATWLLFTGVLARCVVLRVRCPGPLGSCSPVRPLGALCCVCGVLGHLAPVYRRARSVRCVACAVSWATWLLFTGAPARCVVVLVRCLGPLGCVGCRCGARTHPSGWRLCVADRGSVPSGRAHVHPDGGWFVAGRGWVRCRARTRPSARRLFRSRQGLGLLPGAHTSIRTAAMLPGTRSRAVVRCVLCALSGFAAPGGRCCLAPVRVPWLWPAACLSGVPRGPAWCVAPRPVRSLSVLRSAFPTPWCLSPPRGLAPPALASRPRTGLIVPAAGPCRGKGAGLAPRRTRSGPRDGVVRGGSLRRRSRAACAAVVCVFSTRSLTLPVSRTVRLAAGDSYGYKV